MAGNGMGMSGGMSNGMGMGNGMSGGMGQLQTQTLTKTPSQS